MSRLTRRRRTPLTAHRGQQGMTLVETMIAVVLSGVMVIPMLGWGTLAIEQQAGVELRTSTSTTLGLLRTYFIRDVTTASEAGTGPDATGACKLDPSATTALFGLRTSDGPLVYAFQEAPDGSTGLFRLACGPSGGKVTDEVLLAGQVDPKATIAACETAEELDELAAAAGITDLGVGRMADSQGGTGCRRVSLQVRSGAGVRTTLTATLRVGSTSSQASPEPPVAVAVAEPASGRRPLKVQLVAKDSYDPNGSELRYSWDLGDGRSTDEANPVVVYTRTGTITATLTVTNGYGVSASANVVVTSEDNPPVAVISTPASELKVARGVPVGFSSKGSGDPLDEEFGGRIAAYLWDFGDGTTSTDPNPTKRYDAVSPAEGFEVRLGVTDDAGQVATATTRVHVVNRTPKVTIASSATSGTAPLQVQLRAEVTDEPDMSKPPALSYRWELGDGTTSTAAAPTHTYATAGTRTVRLTVTDDQGATASATIDITASAAVSGPPAPTGLRQTASGTVNGSSFISFGWDTTPTATSYQITIRCDGCSTLSGTFAATRVRLNGANPKLTYLVSVRAQNAAGQWGPWTAEIKARV